MPPEKNLRLSADAARKNGQTPVLRYAETAFIRAGQVGIRTIVFGSGAARMVPEGFDKAKAVSQFGELLRLVGPLAATCGITIVVEPLNLGECNFINSLAEGAEIVELADEPNVRLLADFYHMRKESEPASAVVRFGGVIAHTHVAEVQGRAWPGKSGEDLTPYYHALAAIDYTGALSLECAWDAIASEITPSLRFLREQIARVGGTP